MRPRLLVGLAIAALVVAGAVVYVNRDEGPAIIFVHGMGGDARTVGAPGGPFASLLAAAADRYPRSDVCQRDAQPRRPWEGSPCVFRYVDDVATGGRSHSSVRANADKLAREVAEVVAAAGGPVVLVGYSMGGAIIRAYVSLHPRAGEHVRGAVILHGAVSGSWLLASDAAVGRFIEGAPDELERALTGLSDDLAPSPAILDLTPGSPLMRRLAAAAPPQGIAYTTVWGDIRLEIDVPGTDGVSLPSLGDVVLLPGSPNPSTIPPLGGQRFAPGPSAIEIRHGDTVRLGLGELRRLATDCGLPFPPDCRDGLRTALDSPSAHWRIPDSLDRIEVARSELGAGSLHDLVLEAIGREAPSVRRTARGA